MAIPRKALFSAKELTVSRGRAIAKASGQNLQKNAERARQMYEMRLAGMTMAVIATKFRLTTARVSQILTEYTKQELQPYAEEYAQIQKDRLEMLWEKAVSSKKFRDGDPQAIQAAVRVQERFSKLMGLDAPTKVDATVLQVEPEDIEVLQLLQAAQADAQATEAVIKGELVPEDDEDHDDATG